MDKPSSYEMPSFRKRTQTDIFKDIVSKTPGTKAREIADQFPHLKLPTIAGMLCRARQALGIEFTRAGRADGEPPSGVDKLTAYLNDHGISRSELDAVMASAKLARRRDFELDLGRTGKFRFLVMSDTHIGQKMFDYDVWDLAMKVIARDSCEFVLHPGDHLEGMSGRPGHVYELAQIGFKAQMAECIKLYSQIQVPIYGIDGNHDQWYKAKGDIGMVVGEEIESKLPNYHHLGEWEGVLPVSGVKIMLFHANDGTAYANSYKGQKLVESLDTEKPQLIFEGHYHKSLYQYVRRIHQWESGTICKQTGWMRGKKIQAHVGFWRVEVEHSKGKAIGVESKWYCL